MLKAYRYSMYPTTEQKVLLAKSFGCCRWFYNYALNLTNQAYKSTGKGLSRNEIINQLPQLKKEFEWLKEVPSQALQQVALDLSSAFLNFFEKRGKFPRFKKKGNKQSVRFPQGIKLEGDYLTLPKLKKVYCKLSRLPEGKLKSVTVSMTPSGKYFASCLYDEGKSPPAPLIREGKMYLEVERFFPSSKTCNHCLHQIDSLSLDIRSWECPKCGMINDRDINAAKNIRDEGLRLLAVGHIASASGERVRPSKGTAFRRHRSVKEESPVTATQGA